MAIVIGATLAILSVVVTLFPFFKRRFLGKAADVSGRAAVGAGDVEEIYGAIRTLHLEYQLGNIAEQQYREQLLNYRLQAARALQEQDRRRGDSEALESEILTARASIAGDAASDHAGGDDHSPHSGTGGTTVLPADSAPAGAPGVSDP